MVEAAITQLKSTIKGVLGMEDHLAPLDATWAERALMYKIKKESLTYLSYPRLASILDCIRTAEEQKIPGDLIEAGCALGGSATLISRIKSANRPFRIYDVFGMIPPPSENDDDDVHERYEVIRNGESEGIGGNRYYGYEPDLYTKIGDTLTRFWPAACGK